MRACALAVALTGCLTLVVRPAAAQHHRTDGFGEIVIYDAGAHELGRPAIDLVPGGDELEVKVAPAVHVHRYYYNGAKEYQGPIVAGGPTIVVARHPTLGEMLYIDVDLPAGAPEIAYTHKSITYIYPDERVCILFCWIGDWLCDQPVKVVYKHGRGITRYVADGMSRWRAHNDEHHQQSRTSRAVHDATDSVTKTVVGTLGTLDTAAGATIDRTTAVIEVLPGIQQLQSAYDQEAERRELEAVQTAAQREERRLLPFLPPIP